MPYKKMLIKCLVCEKEFLASSKKVKYCGTGCWNKISKTKDVTGYKKCKGCTKEFPFRSSLKVRGHFSKKYGRQIGSINQEFCSKKCSLGWRNENENPAQSESGRKKISEFATKRGTSHLHTEKIHKKQAEAITGENHWNWQGGITSENKRRRNLKEYKIWREAIFKRDNWTCVLCFARNGNGKTIKLNADHIKPWSIFPELRLNLDNGRTLCIDCHKKTDTYMGRIKNYKK